VLHARDETRAALFILPGEILSVEKEHPSPSTHFWVTPIQAAREIFFSNCTINFKNYQLFFGVFKTVLKIFFVSKNLSLAPAFFFFKNISKSEWILDGI